MALGNFYPSGSSLWSDKATHTPRDVPANQKVTAEELNNLRDAMYDLRTGLTSTSSSLAPINSSVGSLSSSVNSLSSSVTSLNSTIVALSASKIALGGPDVGIVQGLWFGPTAPPDASWLWIVTSVEETIRSITAAASSIRMAAVTATVDSSVNINAAVGSFGMTPYAAVVELVGQPRTISANAVTLSFATPSATVGFLGSLLTISASVGTMGFAGQAASAITALTGTSTGSSGSIPTGVQFRDDFTGASGSALGASWTRVPDSSDTSWLYGNSVTDQLRISHVGTTATTYHGYAKSVATYAVGTGRYVKIKTNVPAVDGDAGFVRGITLVGDNGRVYCFGMAWSSQYDAMDFFIGNRWDIIYRTSTGSMGSGTAIALNGPTLDGTAYPIPSTVVIEARFTDATHIAFYLDGNSIGTIAISSIGSNMSIGPGVAIATSLGPTSADFDWIETGGV